MTDKGVTVALKQAHFEAHKQLDKNLTISSPMVTHKDVTVASRWTHLEAHKAACDWTISLPFIHLS